MKKENGYFTVEAALVIPMVISVILFVIYMMLFQYDRCLMEQDMGAMALWGSRAEASDGLSLEDKIRQRLAALYTDKYAAWEMTALNASLEKNRFSVTGRGNLTFPVSGWNFWSRENVWSSEAVYSCTRLSPVTFVRLCHKFNKGKEEAEEGG